MGSVPTTSKPGTEDLKQELKYTVCGFTSFIGFLVVVGMIASPFAESKSTWCHVVMWLLIGIAWCVWSWSLPASANPSALEDPTTPVWAKVIAVVFGLVFWGAIFGSFAYVIYWDKP